MYIVCPSCSGPYRIAADQVAPLVQTACPHCSYRIILDFEAANEPSLREAGHQFAQGFESIEAYASVYDHVTSKPDAVPRAGVTAVAEPARAAAAASTSGTRPLQQRSPEPTPRPTPAPAATTPAATSGGRSKTVVQVPSKKPISMDPRAGDTPSALTNATGSSMRAGRGVDVVEADAAAERKPPHTPPAAGMVSSGPVATAPATAPEDPAAQSGSRPAEVSASPVDTKPADTKPADAAEKVAAATKSGDKPTTPAVTPAVKPTETKSSPVILIIVVLILAGVIVGLVMLNR